jgi:hypothetical protein
MADSRRSLLLAAVALLVNAGISSAQSCASTVGAPADLRSEGETELTGAILLSCSALSAATTVDLDVTMNNGTVPITSRAGEANVQVNGGTPILGTGVSLGSLVPNNGVRFTAVAVPAGTSSIVISGIRANMNPDYVPLTSGGFGEVQADISVSNGSLPIIQAGLFVGIVLPGLGVVSVAGPILSGCGAGIILGAGVNFTVNVPELFPTVFKIQGPNGDSDSETGTIPGALQADSATQLSVSMASLPSGITFYLPLAITSNGPGSAVLVTGPGSTTPMSSGLVTLGGVEYEPVSAGGTYYYNVTSTNPGMSEAFSIPLYNSAATFTSGFMPTITVNLAPTASISPATVPRFLGVAPAVGLGFTPSATVSPASISADSTGGSPQTLTVVTSPPSCSWSASTDFSWIQLTPTSGAGGGTLTATLSANTTGADRIGSILINDAIVPVTQAFTAEVFADVPPSAYYFDAVNLLADKGITDGCSPTDFCPTQSATRAEMAILIVRSVFGGDNFSYGDTPYFTDVPAGSFGFAWIQKMFELGITNGCRPGLFCPSSDVTRAQMAIFIIRMRYGSSYNFDYPSVPYFADVSPSTFGWAWIQRMKEDNITSGCEATLYCPNNPVTRGDMAIFIMHGGFNELLPLTEPVLSSINPAVIYQGGSPVTYTITGVNTNFASGSTTLAP